MTQHYPCFQPRKYLLAAALLLQTLIAAAQTTVQIGTGTSTPSSTLYAPLYRFSATSTTTRSRNDMLFTAAEMAAAGIPAGAVITAIEFNKTNSANFVAPATHSTYMTNSANTALATTTTWASIAAGFTPVYSSSSFNIPLAAGWVKWQLTSPFTYTGGALEIAMETVMTGGSAGANGSFIWEYTDTIPVDRIIGDASNSTTLNGTVATYRHRPNIRITFSSASCTGTPVAGKAVAAPALVCAGSKVALSLNGATAGSGISVQWQKAASLAGPFVNEGTAQTTPPLEVTAAAGATYYRAAVTCSGNTAYSDTITVTGMGALGGTAYTINAANPTNGTNFRTFTDAVTAMQCGISGPVVFTVTSQNTVYNEQLIIPRIPGASATNTITFKGNGNTVSFASANDAERATIKLNDADHFIFDSLQIEATGTYGFGVQLINDADSNTFRNCIISTVATASTTNFSGVVISASATAATTSGNTLCNGNLFTGNTVSGGYYGMTMIGGTSAAIANSFINNEVKDFYVYGIYIGYTSGAVVEGNRISRPARSSVSTFYGIYCTTGSTGLSINRNRIFNPFGAGASTSSMYGIYFSGCDATAAAPNMVTNNLLYNFNGSGVIYGMYNSSSDYVNYYHNTLVFDNENNTTDDLVRGFYQITAATGINIKNNLIYITRGGGGTNHGIYMSTATTTFTSDYNNFFLKGSNTSVGYYSASQATLSDWIKATQKDSSSLTVEPLFADIATGNYMPVNDLLDNKGTPVGVTADVRSAARSATTPDIGAYEFVPAACPDPPVAGTVIATNETVCMGGTVSLRVQGGSIGTGRTLQWQSSADGTSWNSVSGEVNSVLNIAQSNTTWYRIQFTCGAGTTPSAPLKITTPDGMSGNYTINSAAATSGRNFHSFTDAYTALKCGISDAVVFDVLPGSAAGVYTEQLIMTEVPGASAAHTVTFNGNGNTLAFKAEDTNERAVIKLNGADHIIFDSLRITALGNTSTTYGFGIQLMNNADSNIVRRCIVTIDTTQTGTGYAGIVISSSNTSATSTLATECDYNTFENNTVSGGYYSMTVMGSTAVASGNNMIRRNRFLDFYYYGLYVSGSFNTLIDSNIISRPNRSTVSVFNGIYFTSLSTKAVVTRNTITNPFGGAPGSTSTFNGIYFSSCDALPKLENIVSNNLIYNITGNGSVYGFYNSGSDNVWFLHNTVHLDGASTDVNSVVRAVYQTTQAGGVVIKNNIFTIARGGAAAKHALYFNTPASEIVSDRNNFFISATQGDNNVGYNGASMATLFNWQQTTKQDSASHALDPLYKDVAAGNFEPVNASLNDLGQAMAATVAVDIRGKQRSTTAPDMGAFEFSPPPCTSPATPGTAVVNETPVCENTTVELNLTGNSTGYLQTYQWQVATDIAGTYAPISSQRQNTVFTTQASATFYYRAAVTCNGVTAYSTPVQVSVNPALPGGTYIIDQNGSGDFASFNEARAAMACGITGPVIFNVAAGSGPYEEQLVLDSIRGTSATNTITFNGNGNTINYSSSVSAERGVITLKGTDYVTFNNLTIDANGTGTYGWGVFLTNNADSNTFRNCTILATTASTSSNYAGVVISSSATGATTTGNTYCDGNLFENNRVSGGYYGMTMVGGTGNLITGNRFINNRVEDFYYYGIYAGPTSDAVIEGNQISRGTRTSVSTFNGIYSSGTSNNLLISKNKIFNAFDGNKTSTSTAYGIYLTGNDAPANAPTLVVNNLIYNMNGSGSLYGFYNSSSSNVRYYHNTLALDDTAAKTTSTTYGFYQITEAEGIEFKNNMMTITRGGTGTRYGIYLSTAATVLASDYNNIYVKGSAGTNYFGYAAAARASLSAWQTQTTQDANSFESDPLYTDAVNANYTPLQGFLDNEGTGVGVASDITGAVRNAATPDMGAFEFSITPCIDPPTPGKAVANPSSGICLGTTIAFSLTGNTTGKFQTYLWQRAASAAGPWTDISDTAFAPGFSYQLNTMEVFFRAMVKCGSSVVYSEPVELLLNPILPAGDYTIDPAQPTAGRNFASFNEAVAAMECGIQGAVRFHAVPGVYEEQVRIPRVPGSSASATVTFLSRDNSAATVTLRSTGTSTANYVLKLDGTQYVTFRNITFTALSEEYGRVVEIAGASSYDSLYGCVLNAPEVNVTSTNVAAVYGATLTGKQVVLYNNQIRNGSSGVYVTGTTLLSGNYQIENNTITGSYQYSVYVSGINNCVVNNNTITRSGIQNASGYAIYLTNCDSAYRVNNNLVNIDNTGTIAYGIYITGSQSAFAQPGSVSGNKILSGAGNTGNMYGLYLSSSTMADVRNNVVLINTTGASSYGLYVSSAGDLNCYNNTIQNAGTSGWATNANTAAYISVTSGSNGVVNMRNNIFSHFGKGLAMVTASGKYINSDYNLYYAASDTLIQLGTATTSPRYTRIQPWRDTSYWDYNSIVYRPAFTGAADLTPDVNNGTVWAMHGRGVQVKGNNTDINGNARPDTLTAGVPDMGAYEFIPLVTPVALTATPAVPAPNTVQVFTLGSDTVTRITWGASVPASVEGKRYSGVMPPALAANQPYMYFYTQFTAPGGMPAALPVQQYYVGSWMGFIENEKTLKLGKTIPAGTWTVDDRSRVEIFRNTLTDSAVNNLDKLTGLTDGKAVVVPPVVISPSDSSNRGTSFWVGYGHHQDFSGANNQEMVLYLGAGAQPATVTVSINGTEWVKTYQVPANNVIMSDFIPKLGMMDARLLSEGLNERGISIESNVPITAYAHIYGNTNSGASMLMPVGTYGYEYYALTAKQNYASNTYSWFYVVAAYDSTLVEITPSKPTLNGRAPGVPFRVSLKKGEIYQVLGAISDGSDGYDLTGSRVKSVANVNGRCFPVAVFSGSSRTNIGCGNASPSGSGDNIIQQNFPYKAWGKRYLTTPTSHQNSASTPNTSIFKIVVKDPATQVKQNGNVLTGLIDNLYYQVETSVGDYIEADKPVMVAQFMPSSASTNGCGYTGYGDPEMIYLSPIEQGIKEVAVYRNTQYAITVQYLTLVIPEKGLNSLTIDNSNSFDYVYDHPGLPGYKVVVKRWTASRAQTFVKSDSAFTAITYGLGSAESYGYNAGTLVLNLNTVPAITNIYNPVTNQNNPYTCTGTPFKLKFFSTVQPDLIEWKLTGIPGMTAADDVTQNRPAATDTVVMNGSIYYEYTLNKTFTVNEGGDYRARVFITHPDLEGCDSRLETTLPVKVVAAPKPDFTVSGQCKQQVTEFKGTAVAAPGATISSWKWEFVQSGATSVKQDTVYRFADAGKYQVKLHVIGSEGCLGDTTKEVEIYAAPAVNIVPDSVAVCPGGNASFTVQNPVTDATYNWYDAATAGNVAHTGSTWTISNITGQVYYWVASEWKNCISEQRKPIKAVLLPQLTKPVAVVESAGKDTIRFAWAAVAGAVAYEVSIDNGTTWSTPSSGTTGLYHTVRNLQLGQTVTLLVRVTGGCVPTVSDPVQGTTMVEDVFIPNAFSPNSNGPAENERFRIYGNAIRELRYMIFNQWGEKIFETRNQQDGWDGTWKGKPQPSGVYIYVADILLNDGKRLNKKGTLNLVR